MSEITLSLAAIGNATRGRRMDAVGEQLRPPQGRPERWLEDPPAHSGGRDSWRFHLLAYMESNPAEVFEGTWEESRYRDYPHPLYCLTGNRNKDGYYTTNCLAITGPGALAGSRLSTVYEKDAILVVVVNDTDVPWGKSGDLAIDVDGRLLNEWPGPIWGRWIGVLFGDGRVWLLEGEVPLHKLSLFFTVENAKKHCAEAVLGQYKIHGYEAQIF